MLDGLQKPRSCWKQYITRRWKAKGVDLIVEVESEDEGASGDLFGVLRQQRRESFPHPQPKVTGSTRRPDRPNPPRPPAPTGSQWMGWTACRATLRPMCDSPIANRAAGSCHLCDLGLVGSRRSLTLANRTNIDETSGITSGIVHSSSSFPHTHLARRPIHAIMLPGNYCVGTWQIMDEFRDASAEIDSKRGTHQSLGRVHVLVLDPKDHPLDSIQHRARPLSR